MADTKIKTFPLTVTQEWLDKLDKAKKHYESKHDFIIRAVNEKVKLIESGNEITYENKEDENKNDA